MGMNSPELLLLVENCPKGAETLVTRCLHILTDKGKKKKKKSLFRIKMNRSVKHFKRKAVFFHQYHRPQSWWRESETCTTNGCLTFASLFQSSTASRRYHLVPVLSYFYKTWLSTSSLCRLPMVFLERGHPSSSQTDQAQPYRGERGVQPPAGHATQ